MSNGDRVWLSECAGSAYTSDEEHAEDSSCICATIAFGLGIDKGDVRYVIRKSLSSHLMQG
jgi:superfamily II DNA helicase RecQ